MRELRALRALSAPIFSSFFDQVLSLSLSLFSLTLHKQPTLDPPPSLPPSSSASRLNSAAAVKCDFFFCDGLPSLSLSLGSLSPFDHRKLNGDDDDAKQPDRQTDRPTDPNADKREKKALQKCQVANNQRIIPATGRYRNICSRVSFARSCAALPPSRGSVIRDPLAAPLPPVAPWAKKRHGPWSL